MANRILVGSRATGGYGLYISKSGEDVLVCDEEDLSFWTDHAESGNSFVSKGLHQLVPTSVSAGGVPVETGSISVSANVAASAAWQNLGEDVMVIGGTKSQLEGDGFAEDNIPVSYTHLTLPTIYSV